MSSMIRYWKPDGVIEKGYVQRSLVVDLRDSIEYQVDESSNDSQFQVPRTKI